MSTNIKNKQEFMKVLENLFTALPSTETPRESNNNPNKKENLENLEEIFSKVKTKKDGFLKIRIFDPVKRKRKIFWYSKDLWHERVKFSRECKGEGGELSLECDVDAFTWVFHWLNKGNRCRLTPSLLFPVFRVASYLNIDVLQYQCFQFWRENFKIIEDCGDDELLTEQWEVFAAMFTNIELEDTSSKPHLRENLYCTFIKFLNHEIPNNKIGHYISLSQVYQCQHCGEVISSQTNDQKNCSNILLTPSGDLHYLHQRALNWCLDETVSALWTSLEDWGFVYWKLWGMCHFMVCSVCLQAFSVSNMKGCVYHKKHIKEFKGTRFYPCCNQKIYSFSIVPYKSGCSVGNHIPYIRSEQDEQIFQIFTKHQNLIENINQTPKKPPSLNNFNSHSSRSLLNLKKINLNCEKNVKSKKYRMWNPTGDVGLNQDIQRDLEDLQFDKIMRYLSNECSSWEERRKQNQLLGGSYAQIERGWWSSREYSLKAVKEKFGSSDN